MPNKITIKDYDRATGLVKAEATSPLQGYDVDGKHYIVRDNDFLGGSEGREGLVIPNVVYELVSYDEQTGTAKARKVTERSLLEKIAVELHLLRHQL